ncbi:putative nuclease HARBI1 [Heterodontus francisci]|uniref:putative nuclease HARBI1 n=1 Tax=Heterodontus francisci TaxID=7792 RepID=UPI00355C62CA
MAGKEANLCALLQDSLRPLGFGGHSMPVALKITIALNFYASGSFQGSTEDMCGVSKAVAHCCIKELTNARFKRADNYAHYWTDPDSQVERAIGFGAMAGFPQEQGVIDYAYVVIKSPMEQPVAFLNRKCFHSINVQLGWILGDKGYLLKTWLRTSVRNPRNATEKSSNNCYSSTRVTIEQTIGLLKMRFHCLDPSGGALQYAPSKVSRVLVVFCALHDLALQRG